jgi:outer membrane protein assembly factor BamB
VAFAPDGSVEGPQDALPDPERLQTGTGKPADESPAPQDWPTFRHDPGRSTNTAAVLASDIKLVWESEVGRSVSSPVAACGKVFVAVTDEHRVEALDMKTGKTVWSYTANGRVDSPPTIHAGMAVFGDRDGWVYCVSSATGELIWSLQAAPRQRWLVCREQVESAWPVHGSVLIEGDTAYFAAGRHTEVDGGMLLYAVSPETGEILWKQRLVRDLAEPTDQDAGSIANDVLVSQGRTISMNTALFEPRTGALIRRWNLSQRKVAGLYYAGSAGGLLADYVQPIAGWHEQHWRLRWYSSALGWGHHSRGLILAFDAKNVFGVRTAREVEKNEKYGELEIFSCSANEGSREKVFWRVAVPKGVLPKAMLLAGDKLYVAASNEDEAPTKGVFLVYAVNDGASLGAIPVDAVPRGDGLAAVTGRLVLVGPDGRVMCLAED